MFIRSTLTSTASVFNYFHSIPQTMTAFLSLLKKMRECVVRKFLSNVQNTSNPQEGLCKSVPPAQDFECFVNFVRSHAVWTTVRFPSSLSNSCTAGESNLQTTMAHTPPATILEPPTLDETTSTPVRSKPATCGTPLLRLSVSPILYPSATATRGSTRKRKRRAWQSSEDYDMSTG